MKNYPQKQGGLSAIYAGLALISEESVWYSSLVQGLEEGKNPLMLWRQFRKVNMGEMAAVLGVSRQEYNGYENGLPISHDKMRGICWYLDVHPVDFVVEAPSVAAPHFVDAVISSCLKPQWWPHSSDAVADDVGEVLEKLVDPARSRTPLLEMYYDVLGTYADRLAPLQECLETILVNDGNPAFGVTATHFFQRSTFQMFRDLKRRENRVRDHDLTYQGQLTTFNRRGYGIYGRDWSRVKVMMCTIYNRDYPDVLADFLLHDVPRPDRRFKPVKDADLQGLANAYVDLEKAMDFEERKARVKEGNAMQRSAFHAMQSFMNENRDYITAYDNRQRVLKAVPWIGEAYGSEDHPRYVLGRRELRQRQRSLYLQRVLHNNPK